MPTLHCELTPAQWHQHACVCVHMCAPEIIYESGCKRAWPQVCVLLILLVVQLHGPILRKWRLRFVAPSHTCLQIPCYRWCFGNRKLPTCFLAVSSEDQSHCFKFFWSLSPFSWWEMALPLCSCAAFQWVRVVIKKFLCRWCFSDHLHRINM